MRMTFRELLGECMMRLANKESIEPASVMFSLNHAQQDILIMMREAHNDKLHLLTYMDLRDGVGIYDWPERVGEVVQLERLDKANRALPVVRVSHLGSEIESAGGIPNAMLSVTYTAAEPYTYVPLPGRRFKLNELPDADHERGLRITHLPRVTPMTEIDAVCELPEEIHECLVPRAVSRIAQQGAQLANPQAFAKYEREMADLLVRFLHPNDPERAQGLVEEYGYYEEVF